jgi:predicted nuclease of predicted toxin-antitoxin system
LRLLLDELCPASIAEGLRARGPDAVAIVERPELRNLTDEEVFAAARTERRAVVTETSPTTSRSPTTMTRAAGPTTASCS